MASTGTLHLLCGKMAAGKTTLARQLAAQHHAVLISEDDMLGALYPGEIKTVADYTATSKRLRMAVTPAVQQILTRGIDLVLDFAGNTPGQRAWFRTLFEPVGAPHTLHFVDVTDEQCKAQLRQRSKHLPPGAAFSSEADFDAINPYFRPPDAAEGFSVVRHTPVHA